ncbi:MAG TPA: carbamoyltransferase C-terminal domain-containing protein [Acidobacteriota bacterium]|jgi:carbamoyltransferase|nr:carbamoyltransferase C-terminal domain-containing protein [Acidobacteriota bacterium]
MNILGLWGYSADSPGPTHESGACILSDGKLLAAITEERLSRKKNDGAYPFRAIEEVFRITRFSEKDMDLISLAGLPPFRRCAKMLSSQWQLYRETGIVLPRRVLYALLTAKKVRRVVPKKLNDIRRVEWEHHLCHAAAAFFTSPFEQATVITLDGIGDSAICGTVSIGRGDDLQRIYEFNGYYSPGILYSYVTKAFGFRPARHEGKVTGLAAFGDPNACYDDFKALLQYDGQRHRFFSRFIPVLFAPNSNDLWSLPLMSELMDRFDRKEIAASLQRVLEEEVIKMVKDALSATGIPDLALAGGVFANVKLNQRVRELDGVRSVYIHPGMGDDGLMVGAAYLGQRFLARERKAPFQREYLQTVYLGPEFSEDDILSSLQRHGLKGRRSDQIEGEIAQLLTERRIVGRFAGRMEYGPRALGNRSILADPRDRTINDWLNKRLKRTEFMPFAPSILEENARDYLKGWRADQPAARFMTMTYNVYPGAQKNCEAVVHVDGTARPQVVRSEDNPGYHRILMAYKTLSGLPLVVNTSFNIHEEPIVCTPDDAIRSYLLGCVDALVLENIVVSK